MVFDLFGADHICNTGCYKGENHFNRTTTQQERESTTCECSGETKFGRGVECVNRHEFIQPSLDFLTGQMRLFIWKIVNKLFHTVKL